MAIYRIVLDKHGYGKTRVLCGRFRNTSLAPLSRTATRSRRDTRVAIYRIVLDTHVYGKTRVLCGRFHNN